MKAYYIYPPEAHRKLKLARGLGQTVYVHASSGYGKTALVHEYLKSRHYLEVSCRDDLWDEQKMDAEIAAEKNRNPSAKAVVIIDDLQVLGSDTVSRQILRIAADESVWLILIGRAAAVPWLSQIAVKQGLIRISEQDLSLTSKEIEAYLSAMDIRLEAKDLDYVTAWSFGNAKAVQLFCRYYHEHSRDDLPLEQVCEQTAALFREYILVEVVDRMSSELQEFMIALSVVDSFDADMAEMITGNSRCRALLAQADLVGSFFTVSPHNYRFKKPLLLALRKRMDETMDREAVRGLYYNAGLCYETRDEVLPALEMYEKSGNNKRIRDLLIRNARRNPAAGHYFALRHYYLALPEEDIRTSSVLMAGMSMLYSLLLEPEKSEYWYDQLVTHSKSVNSGRAREARSYIAYLDISLPHRGSKDLIRILTAMPRLIISGSVRLPEFSVTSNLPSVMNGGKDFCDWSLHDRELAASIGKAVSFCLGAYGKGLVHEALGESFYEKGGDTYEIISHLSNALMEAQTGGKKEMEFVVTALLERLNILLGREDDATNHLKRFEESLPPETPEQLRNNLEAMQTRIALYRGDLKQAEEWMHRAPDENLEFVTMERYRYLTKVRCYIAEGNYISALAILEKLISYADRYYRHYTFMESTMLKAVVLSRSGKDFLPTLETMLVQAHHYHFVRILSEEGAAIVPLLKAYEKWKERSLDVSEDWFRQIMAEAEKMEGLYPGYLRQDLPGQGHFSDQALSVLSLTARGYTARQIAEALGIKESTVRYHLKQVYKKLGVSGKGEAILAARNMGLLK